MNELLFEEIKLPKNFININEKIRLYYWREEDDNGFDFIALECNGFTCDGKNEYFFSPTSLVEIILEGIAYFDGIRHLYYGSEKSDNYGYHFYPKIQDTIKVLTELRKLEEKYCRDID